FETGRPGSSLFLAQFSPDKRGAALPRRPKLVTGPEGYCGQALTRLYTSIEPMPVANRSPSITCASGQRVRRLLQSTPNMLPKMGSWPVILGMKPRGSPFCWEEMMSGIDAIDSKILGLLQ